MNENIDFYFALSILIGALTIWLADPDKGTLQKVIYWFATPILIVILMSVATKNLILGIGAGLIFYGLITAGYFRFRT
ncbi:hypothetical protein [Mycobacteroides abscessus]|uniref:hypothetical protein n=1 Tax=Mycobacteroides abscessus TaxID=36809 RepID=UPI00046D0F82|nr:hypothetical protein [Mycobacteroides abscessus]MDO3126884.1 hypothetical protein [Mycobacteroides abscessus subsp. bolletii]PVA52183.1 hypothetical protein DDJ35_00710 [Mycobacteroides abscessus]RIQ86378.1 hypothetical protein D2E34_20685 [Mycobacteroides abscessus]RIS78130.1 hypothetical protein D2E44_23340 [Mycobacteroides abscessus]SIJ41465.1 Uncharacterised protein [Mycobacteroides abscessus subsp. bolletii]